MITNGMRLIPIKLNSKIPALDEWRPYQTQAPTLAEIEMWKIMFPGCNWAMITGKASGIVVLDVDVRHNGMDSLKGLVIPRTRTILTQSGGWHYYFVCPPQGCRTMPALFSGVDLKADGGYVLVPPSSIDGNPYEVAVDELVAPMPAWLVAKAFPTYADRTARAQTPSSEWVELLRGVGEGKRNATCARLAGWLLGHGLGREAVEELLFAWNVRNMPPLPRAEVRECVESIGSSEWQKRARRHDTIEV